MKLDPEDAELTVRLSDLSGMLQNEAQFFPYLTVYPLVSGKFYAVARTWLDRDVPRAGCVLTRTILVPIGDWTEGSIRIGDILPLLSEPTRNLMEQFSQPILTCQTSQKNTSLEVSRAEVEVFAAKYFGEGVRPIVWFTDHNPETTLLAIMNRLWPNLRHRFAACTLSLQPRMLQSTPFDLLFAPTSAYSRFTRIARDNVIEPDRAVETHLKIEPWMRRLADDLYLSGRDRGERDSAEILLGPEPTAIRSLYLLDDLRRRALSSPTAALGAMDVLETLYPAANSMPDLKTDLTKRAVAAIEGVVDDAESFQLLHLICERLVHRAFQNVGSSALDVIAKDVERKSIKDLEQGLSNYEALLGKASDLSSVLATIRGALTSALLRLSGDRSLELRHLHRHDLAASDIVSDYPQIAAAYVEVVGKEMASAGSDVARWLRTAPRDVKWGRIADALLPVSDKLDNQLLEDIATRLSKADIIELLEKHRASNFQDKTASLAIAQYIAWRQPLLIRQWASDLRIDSAAVVYLLSATYAPSSVGLKDLLEEGLLSPSTKDLVLKTFLSRLMGGALPLWLREALAENNWVARGWLNALNEPNQEFQDILPQVLGQLEIIAPDAVLPLCDLAERISDTGIRDQLCELALRSAIRWTLCERIKQTAFAHLLDVPEMRRWLHLDGGSFVAAAVSAELRNKTASRTSGWVWLMNAPETLYSLRGMPTLSIIHQLVQNNRGSSSFDNEHEWERVLARAQKVSPSTIYLRHCVQALVFSFKNTGRSLGKIVSTAFPPVYKVVANDSPNAVLAETLFSYDWDKAKALRRHVVDSFMDSNWAPGDLALAASESFGLRVLYKRVSRKWRGDKYVTLMIEDLKTRGDSKSRKLAQELAHFAHDTSFYEPWD